MSAPAPAATPPSHPTRPELAALAVAVLDRNRRGAWTCPSARLYPHQWLWDSCFVAIGLAGHDPARAAGELRSLFRGQWDDGMLPHMIFAGRDAGSRRLWRSHDHPGAPADVETSCITQPPLPAVAARRVAAALPHRDADALLEELVPRLVAYHAWLYRTRDLGGQGLITLIHPWECGLDTTPPWMGVLRRSRQPWWVRAALTLRLTRVVRAFRRDTRFLPACERASDDDGIRMLALARTNARHGFDARSLRDAGSVLIEDVAFNAILAVANHDLEHVAAAVGIDVDPALQARFRATDTALEALWDDTRAQYCSRETVSATPLPEPTIATFLPLWSGVPASARSARLVARLQPGSSFWPSAPVPSVPTDAPQFEPARYWKGPTWVNTNWIVHESLLARGEAALAARLRARTLQLVEAHGFAEYFSPLDGRGYGADEFSWTAALVLDLLAAEAEAGQDGGP